MLRNQKIKLVQNRKKKKLKERETTQSLKKGETTHENETKVSKKMEHLMFEVEEQAKNDKSDVVSESVYVHFYCLFRGLSGM